MKSHVAAYTLFALAGVVLWWRSRAAAGATSLSEAVTDQAKEIFGAVRPATITNRTMADGIPDAANSLANSGMSAWLQGADGNLILAPPGELSSAITAAKTPIVPTPTKAEPTYTGKAVRSNVWFGPYKFQLSDGSWTTKAP